MWWRSADQSTQNLKSWEVYSFIRTMAHLGRRSEQRHKCMASVNRLGIYGRRSGGGSIDTRVVVCIALIVSSHADSDAEHLLGRPSGGFDLGL